MLVNLSVLLVLILSFKLSDSYKAQEIDTVVRFEGFVSKDGKHLSWDKSYDGKGPEFWEHYTHAICSQLMKRMAPRMKSVAGFKSECVNASYFENRGQVLGHIYIAFYHKQLEKDDFFNNKIDFAYLIFDAHRTGASAYPQVYFDLHRTLVMQVGQKGIGVKFNVILRNKGRRVYYSKDFEDFDTTIFNQYKHLPCTDMVQQVELGNALMSECAMGCWLEYFEKHRAGVMATGTLYFNYDKAVKSGLYKRRAQFAQLFQKSIILRAQTRSNSGPPTVVSLEGGDEAVVNVQGVVIRNASRVHWRQHFRLPDSREFREYGTALIQEVKEHALPDNRRLIQGVYRINVEQFTHYCGFLYAHVKLQLSTEILLEIGYGDKKDYLEKYFRDTFYASRNVHLNTSLIHAQINVERIANVPEED